jgi:hypothetical protein
MIVSPLEKWKTLFTNAGMVSEKIANFLAAENWIEDEWSDLKLFPNYRNVTCTIQTKPDLPEHN